MQLLEKTSRWNLNVLFFVVYRMSAVRNPIKEPTDITGGNNEEMEVTFHFFICNMTVKRGQRGFHEGWNLAVVMAQPDIEFASHTQLIQTSAGCSCQSGLKPDGMETKQAQRQRLI